MASKIINYIKKKNPPNPNWKVKLWFTHNIYNTHIDPTPFQNFELKWGDRDILPLTLYNEINNLQLANPHKTYSKITKTFHIFTAAKWKIKFYSIYNQQIPHTSLLQDNNILKLAHL